MFVVVSIYFIIEPVRKLLGKTFVYDLQSYQQYGEPCSAGAATLWDSVIRELPEKATADNYRQNELPVDG
jgi:hypothetical protein